ncbi:hypothetical protein V2G26_006917 [Clonostachys chloroleuca]
MGRTTHAVACTGRWEEGVGERRGFVVQTLGAQSQTRDLTSPPAIGHSRRQALRSRARGPSKYSREQETCISSQLLTTDCMDKARLSRLARLSRRPDLEPVPRHEVFYPCRDCDPTNFQTSISDVGEGRQAHGCFGSAAGECVFAMADDR